MLNPRRCAWCHSLAWRRCAVCARPACRGCRISGGPRGHEPCCVACWRLPAAVEAWRAAVREAWRLDSLARRAALSCAACGAALTGQGACDHLAGLMADV